MWSSERPVYSQALIDESFKISGTGDVYMSEFVSTIAKRRLQDAINRLKSSVEAPRAGNWKRLSDAELWGRVLVQISVVGGAESGGRLRNE